jgi:hypothetical protein
VTNHSGSEIEVDAVRHLDGNAGKAEKESGSSVGETSTAAGGGKGRMPAGAVGFLERYALVAVFLLCVAVFGSHVPDTFLTVTNARNIGGNQAVLAVVALAAIIPLIGGNFDLSLGASVGVSAIVAGAVVGDAGLPAPMAIVAGVAASTAIGALNGLIVNEVRPRQNTLPYDDKISNAPGAKSPSRAPAPSAAVSIEIFELLTFIIRGNQAFDLTTDALRRRFVGEHILHRLPSRSLDDVERIEVTPWTAKGTMVMRVWCKSQG